jgi:putative FmdB family regulatory protein
MPLYTYTCKDHGEFAAWGQMSAADQPQPCPSCATPAGRALAHPSIGGKQSAGGDGMSFGGGDSMPSAPSGGHVCGGGCMH